MYVCESRKGQVTRGGCAEADTGLPTFALALVLGPGEGKEHADGTREHLQADEEVLEPIAIAGSLDDPKPNQHGNQNPLHSSRRRQKSEKQAHDKSVKAPSRLSS